MNLLHEHEKNVRPFRGLYDRITEYLTLHADELDNTSLRDWVHGLIDAFESRYREWPVREQEFLGVIYSRDDQYFHLTSLAYLHIMYDLPIVLAESLKDIPESKLRDYQKVYCVLHRIIRNAFLSNWEGKSLLLNLSGQEVWQKSIDQWLHGLRDRAWQNALMILQYPEHSKHEKLHAYHRCILTQLVQFSRENRVRSSVNVQKLKDVKWDIILAVITFLMVLWSSEVKIHIVTIAGMLAMALYSIAKILVHRARNYLKSLHPIALTSDNG